VPSDARNVETGMRPLHIIALLIGVHLAACATKDDPGFPCRPCVNQFGNVASGSLMQNTAPPAGTFSAHI
jgi:hypothetical protein